MSKVILPVKPLYFERISQGQKRFEYRTRLFKKEVSAILFYVTQPVGLILGEARVSSVLCDQPLAVWEQTAAFAGVDEQTFRHYFAQRELAVAYELADVIRYQTARTLGEFGLTRAPQSYCYVHE